ncbi:hypothetical protein [Methanoculleus chikugoensis]|uniref:hypothetical protein n=1 Tax=Methanoculleus chikugoensis TaxID=118126 RepID=UPI001FB214FC|nr:hypothetical protein [Methanoculleus chikugoensis]
MSEDIEVEVRLPVCHFKPPVEHSPPHDSGPPDLAPDGFEERTLVAREESMPPLVPMRSAPPTTSDSTTSGMQASAANPNSRRRRDPGGVFGPRFCSR